MRQTETTEQVITRAQENATKYDQPYHVFRAYGMAHGMKDPILGEPVPNWHEPTRESIEESARLYDWICVCYPESWGTPTMYMRKFINGSRVFGEIHTPEWDRRVANLREMCRVRKAMPNGGCIYITGPVLNTPNDGMFIIADGMNAVEMFETEYIAEEALREAGFRKQEDGKMWKPK